MQFGTDSLTIAIFLILNFLNPKSAGYDTVSTTNTVPSFKSFHSDHGCTPHTQTPTHIHTCIHTSIMTVSVSLYQVVGADNNFQRTEMNFSDCTMVRELTCYFYQKHKLNVTLIICSTIYNRLYTPTPLYHD